jgi:hypothetical protein
MALMTVDHNLVTISEGVSVSIILNNNKETMDSQERTAWTTGTTIWKT